jgi:hypothetical protein
MQKAVMTDSARQDCRGILTYPANSDVALAATDE